jgi:rRNA maturation protein Nop10
LFLCSVSALAQQAIETPSNSGVNRDQEKPAWKLSFDPARNSVLNDRYSVVFPPNDSGIAYAGRVIDDSVCYTMRSYVVARDSKDSDSVHPVRYSTCQPAGRYRLRTTEAKTISLRH